MIQKGDEFTCEMCRGQFTANRDHREAMVEAEILYGHELAPADAGIICDDCYKQFLDWFERNRKGCAT